MAYGRVSAYLSQYLNTATDGNVTVEYAADVDRYRLCCKSCGQTLTYGDASPLPTMYEKDGMLDDSIQQFARFHRHKPRANEKEVCIACRKSPCECFRYEIKYGVAKRQSTSKAVAIVPRKTVGRKFKP
jgi:hypothetical protein